MGGRKQVWGSEESLVERRGAEALAGGSVRVSKTIIILLVLK